MTTPPREELSPVVRRAADLYDAAEDDLRDDRAGDAMAKFADAITAFDDLDAPTPADDRLRALIIGTAGYIYDRTGDYGQARFRYLRAAEILSGAVPADDLELLRQRYNAAEVARVSGDVDTALTEFDAVRPLAVARAAHDEDAKPLLVLLDKNRGQALESKRRWAEAEASYAEALAASDDDAQRLGLRISVAVTQRAQDKAVEIDALERDLDRVAGSRSRDDDYVLAMRLRLAQFLPPGDRRAAACQEVVDALGDDPAAEQRRLLGVALLELGLMQLAARDRTRALGFLLRLAGVTERVYANDVRAGDTLARPVDPPWPIASMLARALSLPGEDHPDGLVALHRAATGYKRGQAELLLAQYKLGLTRPDLTSLVDDVRALRANPGGGDGYATLQSAQAAAVPEGTILKTFERSAASAVAAELGSGTVLIEYVRLTALSWDDKRSEIAARYGAFVLRSGADVPVWVDLGSPDPIDAAVTALAEAIPGADGRRVRPVLPTKGDWRQAAAALGALVWAPLADAVGDAATVTIAPDSHLCAVPFDVLPDGPDGAPLLTTRTLTLVPTGRDLVRLGRRTNLDSTAAVVVADPEFGAPGRPFAPLPGTRLEGRTVAGRLDVGLITGVNARRPAVLASRNAEIIHLATHGYAGGLGVEHHLGPLADCGVALAGANAAGATDPDGVLTGLDVLAMDLTATDLVVLSACDTSLGELDDYEGLQGLSRSFLLGGARAVVSSLWKVDDDATAALMDDFYRRVLGERDRGTALADAKRALYLAQPDRPELWAAFVLTGDADQLMRHRFVWIDDDDIAGRDVDGTGGVAMVDTGGAPVVLANVRLPGMDEPVRFGNLNMRRSYLIDVENALATAAQAVHAADYVAAIDTVTEVLSSIEGGSGGRDEGRCQRARALALRALCRAQQEDFAAARTDGQAAVDLFEQLHGWPQPQSYAMDNLGVTELNLGLVEQGRARLDAALALKLATLPLDHEQIEFTRGVIADVERQLAEQGGA